MRSAAMYFQYQARINKNNLQEFGCKHECRFMRYIASISVLGGINSPFHKCRTIETCVFMTVNFYTPLKSSVLAERPLCRNCDHTDATKFDTRGRG